MHTNLGALLRPATAFALCLCALTFFALAALPAAAATGPTISNVTCNPNPIPAVGGVATVTAQVTPSISGLSSVVLYETYPNSNNTYRTVPMAVGGDGVTYTAAVPVDLNTNSGANGERLYIAAKDPANNETDAAVATQGYDNLPPSITGVTCNPSPIPAAGTTATVTAQVSDTGVGLSSVVLYETYPNSNNTYRTVPMAVGGDGVTYTAAVPVDLNTNSGANGERLYIVATDRASNQSSANVTTQGYDNIPPSITSVTCNPSSIPAVGAVVTVTAQVADTGVGVSSVVLYETYPNSSNTYRTVPMAVGGDGVTYTAAVPVDLNTNSGANGERLYIVATDRASNQSSANVATQGNDNIPPAITSVTTNPDPVPVQGANVTVTAQVTDIGVGVSSVTLYETYPNSNNTYRTAPMAVGSDGVTYTATIPVDLNSNTGANGERLYIIATDRAGNQSTFNVATQGYSSVPATGLLPVLITADPSQPVLSPAYVVSGGPDLSLTIRGINFAAGAVVLFNGVQLPASSQTSRQIVVTVPASLVAQAGCYAVTVVDPSPSGASNTVNLTVYGLFSISVPTPVAGGSVVTARVALNGPAPTDIVIGLSSSDPIVVRVFRAVVIPAGSTGATFQINTYRSHVTKMVTIQASEGLLALRAPLTITGR